MSESLIPEALQALDPSLLAYDEWVQVGMALKAEGYSFEVFHQWSAQNKSHYKSENDVMSHWRSFNASNASTPVTGGTIVEIAKRYGYSPQYEGRAIDWDEDYECGAESYKVVDSGWIDASPLPITAETPTQMLARYIEALFSADEYVSYNIDSDYDEEKDKYTPKGFGVYTQTAGDMLETLRAHPDDIGATIGDIPYPGSGAWIRFNPFDGAGIREQNVTSYKYSLVESDTIDKEKQYALIKELNLPCAAIVDSGKKSIHAIVRIDAATKEEYRQRVDFLFKVCRKNGIPIDEANKNASRLSRMPGVMRGDTLQALLEVNSGPASWDEWREWLEEETDDLPDTECLEDVMQNMPELAAPLINGVLRQGHKMMLAGPSKAGKSLALMELCIAIAEGAEWMGFKCAQGRVLYVNLEIDRASCMHRFVDLYSAMKYEKAYLSNIHVWSLRGNSVPMDKLAPMLIRRARKIDPVAVIIDPIYKIVTGDENSASDMAKFTNQFDKVAAAVGCSVIVCHHHSKGFQGAKKSMDRLSGSGVFARDPDTLIDMSELWLDQTARDWAAGRTGWRLDFTLREFADPGEVNVWFQYPKHTLDDTGLLEKCGVEGDPETSRAKGIEHGREARKANAEMRHTEITHLIREAVQACYEDGVPSTRANVLERIGELNEKPVSKKMLENWTQNSQTKWTAPFRVINGILLEVKNDGTPFEEKQSSLDL